MTLATYAKDVKFYRWPNICYVGVYETPADCMSVRSISWSCDGKEVLVVRSKGNPVVIQMPVKQYIEPYDCLHLGDASVGTFSNANPDLIAFGCDDGNVYVYNKKSQQRHPSEYRKLPSGIQNLEFSSDDQCLAAGCINGQIFLYDCKNKPCASFVVPNSPTLSTMAYSRYTPNLLVGASKEGVLCLWDTETTDVIMCNKNHANRITDVAFFDNVLSSVGLDGTFISYDLRSCSCSECCELDCPLSSLAYLADSYEMAISTTTGQLRSYDSRNMKTPLRTMVATNSGGIKKVAFPSVREEPPKPKLPSAHAKTQQKRGSKSYEEDFSASGDFSIVTDSSLRLTYPGEQKKKPTALNDAETGDDDDSSSDANFSPDKAKLSDLEDVTRTIEEKIRNNVKDFEEKSLQLFYGMRIHTSKQFIGLEEKISQSWNSFVDYLRLSGAASACNTTQRSSRDEYVNVDSFSVRDDDN